MSSYGVETSYVDLSGRTRVASPKALRAVLRALGSRQARRPEPVRVVWDKRPFGYHREGKTLVISAPRRCFQGKERSWGLFLPLYALHSKRNPAAGDLTDLKAFALWAGRMGAGWVGTLPLLSQFLDKPFEPSPYSPVSRLFWNEFWIDVGEIKSPRRSGRVDYRRQMEAKWRILEKKAKGWAPPRSWLRDHPEAQEYARFRAGKVSPKTILYGQWLVDRQMEQLRRACDRAGVGLYFDLPLGVHPAGYDAWKERKSFVRGMHVGAPPDPFFAGGQDWGFCPPHPERIREQGYDYFIRCVRHSMRHASMLRVDHIMGLHRLFWVPEGMPAREGVYVRYRSEELYAILSLESHRNRCAVVGEDLGTVPPEVRRSMRRHGLSGMFVVQYEWSPNSRRPLRAAPRQSVACLNTHDMPPFSAFWKKH
ncbi:MAG: 4-alpha-glucanotransferase, partial [Candidatus Omnitrophota bacterium]|nr:4-alpha-glucanotransferase [Candidatus Omnitrophota bacterium]